jgi:hypothetical protein
VQTLVFHTTVLAADADVTARDDELFCAVSRNAALADLGDVEPFSAQTRDGIATNERERSEEHAGVVREEARERLPKGAAMGAPSGLMLRPLGIGEIIDRAITLYLRNFVPFTATVLIVVFVPLAVGEFFVVDSESGYWHTIFQILRHPGTPPPTTPGGFGGMISYPEFFLGYLTLVVGLVLGLFANNAVAVNVAAIYTGRKPNVTASLGVVFRRWTSLLGLLFLGFFAALGAYLIVVALTVLGVFGVGGVAAAFPGAARSPFAITLLVLFIIAAVLAVCALAMLCVLAFTFAGYAIVIEGKSLTEAIGSGFARLFNRKEWGRAVVVLLVALFIAGAISTLTGFAELLLFLVPGGQLVIAMLSAIVGVISGAIQTVFCAVYYYDVRIRREGFDLDMALQRLAPATT